MIEGANPVLRHEYVTIQAHLDEIVNHFVPPDRYGNAADDNASGAAALQRPRSHRRRCQSVLPGDELQSPLRYLDDRLAYPRADHAAFLRQGMPVAFHFTVMHGEYHLSTDGPELIDFPKLQRNARTVFVTAWAVADARDRPQVDRPIPENVRRAR